MTLVMGERLGSYEIVAPIGAGGMGEVYRAIDTTLKRDVALKVLPDTFAGDPTRLARFQREAELLASLNHPNIAHVYGIEGKALVMELVEGPTLPCPLRVDAVVSYGKQIAEALEYAHERGVVHRDLKPANIKITPDGIVKVLDFGLAKAVNEPLAYADPTSSPTMTFAATGVGTIMGTAAYMSPEQANGNPVDRRSDIWSFGAVLYEMLTGRQAFRGESVSDTLGSVLKLDPDWAALPADTPESLRTLIRRCLTKDRKQRLQAIGEARIVLERPERDVRHQTLALASPSRLRLWSSLVALGVSMAVLGSIAFQHFREAPPPPPALIRFEIVAPDGPVQPIISPDGSRVLIARVPRGAGDTPPLLMRALDSLEVRSLPGTEDRTGGVFWSPDSRDIVFAANGKLRMLDVERGTSQILCNVPGSLQGAFWRPEEDRIVFVVVAPGENRPQWFEVPTSGGTASPFPGPVGRNPVLLPDGRHFMYIAGPGRGDRGNGPEQERGTRGRGVYLGSLDAKPNQSSSGALIPDGGLAAYAQSPGDPNAGYVLFLRGSRAVDSTLMAQRLDLRTLKAIGEPKLVADRVRFYSASRNGILVYSTGNPASGDQLTIFDAQGSVLQSLGEPDEYSRPFFSPDGTRVIAARGQPRQLWMFALTRGTSSRFQTDPSGGEFPVWSSPDGTRITFASRRGRKWDIYQKLSNGGGEDELLFTSDEDKLPSDWSRNGRFLLVGSYAAADATGWILPVDANGQAGKPFLFVKRGLGVGFRFSPDPGTPRWVAYFSTRTGGRSEVYLRQFDPTSPTGSPAGSGEWPVSTDGGTSPRWSHDGKKLYYLAADRTLMVAALTGNPTDPIDAPSKVFKPQGIDRTSTAGTVAVNWDISPDDKRFLFPIPVAPESAWSSTVVLNWTSLLKR